MSGSLISSLCRDRRVRFLLAGGMAAAVNWLVRFPLNLVMPFGAAVFCATIIGMTAGFFTYRTYVFNGANRSLHLQLRDFVAINILGMIATAIVALVVRKTMLAANDGEVANAVAHAVGIAAGAVVNYFGHAKVTFRNIR